jgi:hypothetical protein
MRRLCHLVLLIAVALPAIAAAPTPDQFLGYAIGERFTSSERLFDYFHELQRASPLVRIHRYGETYEGRPLIYAVIASAENHGRMDQLREASLEVSSPDRTSRSRAEAIAAGHPLVVWLAFGIHGNESSSSEAAMLVASKLVSGDEEAQRILQNAVVILDPLQNPDGRDRYINWFRQARGREPNVSPEAMEHQEPWPGGRYNHYHVDMNRDWAFASQQETRARIAAYNEWRPQVFVDLHEMSYESSYFFPPSADPINTNIGGDIQRWFEVFGRANADAFSERLWPFFVSERFDLFYPGYGDSWPSLRGAVGMTYEMAGGGRAGSAVQREDGTVLTLADRAERHYVAAMTTLATAAANRRELLLRTWTALNRSLTQPPTVYLLPPQRGNLVPAMEVLRRQGVEVRSLAAPARLRTIAHGASAPGTREFPAGTAVISTRQPLGGLVQSLLERTPHLSPAYLEEQRRRIDADEEDDFYDITAWSIPVAYNLEAFIATGPMPENLPLWEAPRPNGPFAPGRIAYLIDGSDPNIYRAAGAMLRANLQFSVSDSSFSAEGMTFGRGTLLVQRANNGERLDARLQQVAAATGAALVPLSSGWEGELALGSRRLRHVRDPRIALVGGEGTSPPSFGSLWFTFDQDQRIPHTVIPLSRLRSTDLRHYRVLILPEGRGYAGALGTAGLDRLKAWVRAGGTVIAVGEAAKYLRQKPAEISRLREWGAREEAEKAEEQAEEDPGTQRYNDFRVPGAAFRTEMNERSYLTFGVPRPPDVLVEGSTALLPAQHRVDNIVTIATTSPLSSGFAWPESLERLAGSVYLSSEPYGAGQVITFANQPYYRLFWRSTLPLLMNAVLYSPSFPRSE